jgi:hypothetical protein
MIKRLNNAKRQTNYLVCNIEVSDTLQLRFPARGKIFLLVHDRRAKASRRSERPLEIREVIDLFLKINDLPLRFLFFYC